MSERLHLDSNDDVVTRRFMALGLSCALLYVEGMSSGDHMANYLVRPLLKCQQQAQGARAKQIAMEQLIEATELTTEREVEAATEELMRGQCLLLMDTVDTCIVADLRNYVRRSVSPPQTESVIIGPHEAFNESLRDNLTLLHKRLQTPDLVCEIHKVGTRLSTQVALCYLDGICMQETVDELKRRLHDCALDYVGATGVLDQLIEDDPFAPLPQVVSTERPDRAVSFLLEGQAVILLDGSPRALGMPMGFWHLFHAPDDTYMRWQYGTFMRVLRMIGLLVSLLLPAVFVSIVIYHPMMLPMTLLTSIQQSRTVVPMSLFGEAVLMLVVFDLINEAGTRVPGLMGSSLGLVSALILGTAAVDAALVSPLLIIVVALAGLGSYAIPNYPLSFATRMGQLGLVFAGGLFGVTGVALAMVLMLCVIAGMESLRRPFLAPASPARVHNPDLLDRAPIFRQRLRGYIASPGQMLRARGRMRRFEDRGRRKP